MRNTDVHKIHRQRAAMLILVAVLTGVIFAACGTGGPTLVPAATPTPAVPTTTPTPALPAATPTPAEATTEAPPETQAPTGETVIVEDIAFQTSELTVPVGSTVSWDNRDSVAHTVTHGTGGTPEESPLLDVPLPAGEQVSYTFEQAGTFAITCTIHPQMQMSVTVE